jgi:osmotically-inducible protein OsmY
MRLFLLLLALAAAVAAQPHARPPAAPAKAAAPKVSDAEIQARIQAKLAKSKIGRNGFKFTTANGVTTIEGKANVIQHKGAATRLAKTAGARAVINNIQISESARAAAKERLASGRRRAQIKRGEPR